MTLFASLFIIVFFIGLIFYAKCSDPKYVEGLTNNGTGPRCPNLLIQKGSKIYLYNSKLAQVPGVNPIEFENLEDYTEFLAWQRSQGIRCPVLYLQESFDPQGNTVYKIRPSITDPQGGLPPSIASSSGPMIKDRDLGMSPTPENGSYPDPTLLVDATRNDPPYNKNSYPAYDQSSYYIGKTTPLDGMDILESRKHVSPDAMSPNWGGAAYTQSLIDKGVYNENNVSVWTT